MNPSNEAGGLPVPGPGQVPDSTPNDPNLPQPPAPAAVPPMTLPLPPNSGQNPVPQAPQIDVPVTTQAATPPVLDDGDLIEKEWVNKAKQIVEKNRNNPHKQSEELTVFRADYMKKRYNKNIKLDK